MLLLRKKNGPALSDEELIQRYKLNSESHYAGVLFQRYTHLVLGVCLKYLQNEEDSKDAVMEIFEHLLEALLKHEVSNFKSWLHTVARNHCLMKLRRQSQKHFKSQVAIDAVENELVENPEFEHLLDEKARADRIEQLRFALTQLHPHQRTCVELFYLEGRSYQEIADSTGYSLNQVKSHIQNGKRNLKNLLPEKD